MGRDAGGGGGFGRGFGEDLVGLDCAVLCRRFSLAALAIYEARGTNECIVVGREEERDGFKERTTRTRALTSFFCVGSKIDEKQSLKIE